LANISGILGTAGGFKGTGVDAPTTGNFVTPDQVSANYTNAQNALTQQQNFANAVQPGGLAALNSQQQLLGQLQTGAQGGGPNPAMNQLNQATAANTANQAALMAGQRGSSQNVGMIARQADQQGANSQQQAAGQAATMSAQQQIAYMQQLQQQQQNMVGNQAAATGAYTNATQAEQLGLLNAAVGAQNNLNAANTSMIGQTAQQQASFGGGASSGAGSMMSMMAEGGQAKAGDVSTPMPIIQPQAATDPKVPKSAIGKMFSSFAGTSGQQSPGQQFGAGLGHLINNWFSSSPESNTPQNSQEYYGLSGDSPIGDAADEENGRMAADSMQGPMGPQEQTTMDIGDGGSMAAKGGKVPALVSPGEKRIHAKDIEKVKAGADPMEVGKTIPGKAKVKGAKNSYANDTVPMNLNEGDIILPRSVTQAKHPHWEAHKFVSALMAKKGKR